jgi:hypothetical protein
VSEEHSSSPIITITEGIAYFLAGAFIVGTTFSNTTDDLLVQRLSWVAQATGYLLIVFGILYVLPLIPWFRLIKNWIDNKLTPYVYPALFGITSVQVLQIVLEVENTGLLRWVSGIFLLLVIILTVLVSPKKVTSKVQFFINLSFTYVFLATLFVGLRAETWLSLLDKPILEPLVFLIVSLVSLSFLAKHVKKNFNT